MTNLDQEDSRAARQADALKKATERLIRLLVKSNLLYADAGMNGFEWNLVSRPEENRLMLTVDWNGH